MVSATESWVLPTVAIVGISTELPSGVHSSSNLDFESFKDFLLRGQDAYEKFPQERINIQSWKGTGLGQILTDTGAFLKGVTLFDHLEFGVSAKDARAMAVGTRKLLEQSFLALLDSGIDYRGRNVGCYMSAVGFDISTLVEPDEFEARGSFAGLPCMIANRISYHLDLLGPSVPVDTACSSSLTATHLAVQALRNGECESAIVGGCQINHRLIDWINYSQGKVLSSNGKSKPFDASANGFGRGEGTVVIVLKLLSDALRDGDHIYCSILGTALNSSGCAAPVSAPVAKAQKDAMHRAYACTGRSPTEVDFLELHATGTASGDPTEANWVGEAFRRDEELLVGSVKGNLGHLEITAFLASLAKICSIFQTGIIPPNANFKEANPAIKWADYKLRVVTEPTNLSAQHASGRALISIMSSGIGGSNGHVVVEAPPLIPDRVAVVRRQEKNMPILLVAAGLTPRSATSFSEALIGTISKSLAEDMPLLSTILGRRTRQMTWRTYTIVSPEQSSATVRFSPPVLIPRSKPPLVFLFSGQGPQHIDMGRQLFALYPVFRETILCLDRLYKQIVGQSLMKTTGLFDSSSDSGTLSLVWPILIVLPAITMVQLALVDLLFSIRIVPDIVLGHSAGETAMLYACGAASKDMVLSMAIARGTAMQTVEEAGGTMASLSCSPVEAQSIIDTTCGGESAGKIEVACYNAPEAVTIAGLENFVESAVRIAKERGIFATRLRTRVPVHSSIMEICRDKYQSLVHDVFKKYPGNRVPVTTTYSTLTGGRMWMPFTSDYFWQSTRKPVRFSDSICSILADEPTATFLEISPHPVLSAYVLELGANQGAVFSLMRRSKVPDKFHESQVFLDCLGRLVCGGRATVDFGSLNEVATLDPKSIQLPSYPLMRRHVSYLPDTSILASRVLTGRRGPLNDCIIKLNAKTHPVLAQHVIKGEPIMPASGYLEIVFESGARHLWNVEFRSMLSLSAVHPTPVHIDFDGIQWTVGSRPSSKGATGYHLHAEGYASNVFNRLQTCPASLDICSVKNRCMKIDIHDFYETLMYFADYGPAYQRVVACYKGQNEVLAVIRGESSDIENVEQYVFHPAILDSCLHVGVHRMLTGNVDDNEYYLPSHVDDVYLHDLLLDNGTPETLYVHASLRRWTPEHLVFDFIIADEGSSLLCSLIGLEVSKHKSIPRARTQRRYDVVNDPIPGDHIFGTGNQPEAEIKDHLPLPFVLRFAHGNEMHFRKGLQELDSQEPNVIWVISSSGSDGAAAQGLTRSLRREVPQWDIRLVLLPQEWTEEIQYDVVRHLSGCGITEPEILIDKDRNIFRPRVSISPGPLPRSFDASFLWHLNDKRQIVQCNSQAVPENHSLISIDATSLPDAELRGFVGHVLKGRHTGLKVIGIIDDQPLSNYALLHEDQIVTIESRRVTCPELALGASVISLVLGKAAITNPSRLRRKMLRGGPSGV